MSLIYIFMTRRVWRYQRGNQNPYIEEEQTTQWSKEKVRKDKQRSTKHTYKTKDWVTRTPLKTGGELRCSGVRSSCSSNDTRRVNLVTNPVKRWYWQLDCCSVLTIVSLLFLMLDLYPIKFLNDGWSYRFSLIELLLFIRNGGGVGYGA